MVIGMITSIYKTLVQDLSGHTLCLSGFRANLASHIARSSLKRSISCLQAGQAQGPAPTSVLLRVMGGLMEYLLKKMNIEHRTSNVQHPTSNKKQTYITERLTSFFIFSHSKFDVGRSMFDVHPSKQPCTA
jgi:hypothetical protein